VVDSLKRIVSDQTGEVVFDTLGGCQLRAYWANGGLLISDEFGDVSSIDSNVLAYGESVLEIGNVFTAGEISAEGDILPTRLFAGPTQFPPTDFAAYGIMAFPSRASTSVGMDRHLMLCEAYVQSLPHASELPAPRSAQMVTVWPIEDDDIAKNVNRSPREEVCPKAVGTYGLIVALQAIQRAKRAGLTLSGQGPFLLAWSPPHTMGEQDAIVLYVDLSQTNNSAQALEIMSKWRDEITLNPELWKQGWNIEKLRFEIKKWADWYGPGLLGIFGVSR
jgi:hypothetical protein